jgi:hypothetical protein
MHWRLITKEIIFLLEMLKNYTSFKMNCLHNNYLMNTGIVVENFGQAPSHLRCGRSFFEKFILQQYQEWS